MQNKQSFKQVKFKSLMKFLRFAILLCTFICFSACNNSEYKQAYDNAYSYYKSYGYDNSEAEDYAKYFAKHLDDYATADANAKLVYVALCQFIDEQKSSGNEFTSCEVFNFNPFDTENSSKGGNTIVYFGEDFSADFSPYLGSSFNGYFFAELDSNSSVKYAMCFENKEDFYYLMNNYWFIPPDKGARNTLLKDDKILIGVFPA